MLHFGKRAAAIAAEEFDFHPVFPGAGRAACMEGGQGHIVGMFTPAEDGE